ncbi:HAD hydrolase-like protein [Companilactobacillus bobalius]|uniref:Phosphoglycolate phosphatase n=2 Tax=Companilactobacillus bobalius TaxID=2801451 RepID=A0A202FDI1_9LACO|nr:HAD hydrolase-like protein [Companilactobacillus bobalius]KAE9556867.1 haloacid dehalogenase [Companilactobacillus bobalius]KRK81780.1 haloacid dehalogenase family hydrolase [Companilactobacillus bobalius DSM 19674]OVE98510.1 Phosphoglycolate phosphatase [Companilactobacillus bobalius]GEO58890.1 5'-nucleotidase [Companilactobacillus paralimentarius]
MNNLFFDLDGTIINSETGIMKSLRYMYQHTLGYIPHDDATLHTFIGPTIGASLQKYDHLAPDDPLINQSIDAFREYYQDEGWMEYTVYDGVLEMLQELKEADKQLFIATSKPEIFAKRIIDQLNMKEYVRHVFGAAEDESVRSLKEDVISYGIDKTSVELDTKNLVMVGDRSSDIVGAHKNNLKAIGVTYGFGDYDELKAANSEWIVNKPQEVVNLAMEK